MDRQTDGWIDEWMDTCMDGRTDTWIDGWMDGWADAWVDGRTDGWIDEEIDRGGVDGWMNRRRRVEERIISNVEETIQKHKDKKKPTAAFDVD